MKIIKLLFIKDIPYLIRQQEEFEDINRVIRIRKSKKNRQHYDQKKKYKQQSTKHTHKTKDRAT